MCVEEVFEKTLRKALASALSDSDDGLGPYVNFISVLREGFNTPETELIRRDLLLILLDPTHQAQSIENKMKVCFDMLQKGNDTELLAVIYRDGTDRVKYEFDAFEPIEK